MQKVFSRNLFGHDADKTQAVQGGAGVPGGRHAARGEADGHKGRLRSHPRARQARRAGADWPGLG